MDRGVRRAIIRGITKNWTQLNNYRNNNQGPSYGQETAALPALSPVLETPADSEVQAPYARLHDHQCSLC